MTPEQIGTISRRIAAAIFKCGDEPGRPTKRIAYISGRYGIDEQQQGGSCLSSLETIIETELHRIEEERR